MSMNILSFGALAKLLNNSNNNNNIDINENNENNENNNNDSIIQITISGIDKTGKNGPTIIDDPDNPGYKEININYSQMYRFHNIFINDNSYNLNNFIKQFILSEGMHQGNQGATYFGSIHSIYAGIPAIPSDIPENITITEKQMPWLGKKDFAGVTGGYYKKCRPITIDQSQFTFIEYGTTKTYFCINDYESFNLADNEALILILVDPWK